MNDIKKFSLVKPTINTPFHIDFAWWKHNDNNWRIFLRSCLCAEHQDVFSGTSDETWIDFIDPETAEVQRMDGLQHILMTHCSLQPDFLTNTTSTVDLVFRVLFARGNSPNTPLELSTEINRPPETILRTLAGIQVYKGIRPCNYG